MLLKIGICDDESEYTTILADYLKTYDIDSEKDYSFQIDKFTSAKELLSAYTKPETYHILFLDVEMPEITGIELAKKIRMLGDKNVRIVFVSQPKNESRIMGRACVFERLRPCRWRGPIY